MAALVLLLVPRKNPDYASDLRALYQSTSLLLKIVEELAGHRRPDEGPPA